MVCLLIQLEPMYLLTGLSRGSTARGTKLLFEVMAIVKQPRPSLGQNRKTSKCRLLERKRQPDKA